MERVERVIAHLAADDPAPPLLGQNKTAAKKKFNPSDLKLRFLEKGDYDKKFCQLLGQLTDVGTITKDMFEKRFDQQKKTGVFRVAVIEDKACQEIIASATLVIEDKFIHSCGRVGHIEDVVVNSLYRGASLGKRVSQFLTDLAREEGCYKTILDCDPHNIPFYNKLGYKQKSCHMAIYYDKK